MITHVFFFFANHFLRDFIFVLRSLVLMAVIVGTSYYIDRSQDAMAVEQPVVSASDILLRLSWPLQSQYNIYNLYNGRT